MKNCEPIVPAGSSALRPRTEPSSSVAVGRRARPAPCSRAHRAVVCVGLPAWTTKSVGDADDGEPVVEALTREEHEVVRPSSGRRPRISVDRRTSPHVVSTVAVYGLARVERLLGGFDGRPAARHLHVAQPWSPSRLRRPSLPPLVTLRTIPITRIGTRMMANVRTVRHVLRRRRAFLVLAASLTVHPLPLALATACDTAAESTISTASLAAAHDTCASRRSLRCWRPPRTRRALGTLRSLLAPASSHEHGTAEARRYHRRREPRRAEVRRHVGRRPRPHQGRRRAHRRDPSWPGHDVVVVVSAMGKTTDDLERLAHEVSAAPAGREMDMLLTAGERISIALLCMAIIDRGEHAVSFTGSQAGIVTDTTHGQAKILDVRADRLREAVADGRGRGRRGLPGGLDRRPTSRRSAAAAPTPPRSRSRPRSARRSARSTPTSPACSLPIRASCPRRGSLDRVSYEEMLDMAATGGRVLALRSVEFARNHGVPRARPVELHVGAGHLGGPTRSGGRGDGAGDHLGRHPRHVRGEGDDRARARPSRRRRARCSARWPTRP